HHVLDPNMEEVKLLGFWPSPYSQRVKWALKLKGVSYEYVEEDLSNKSNLLLQHNPIHKRVPVLVHGGKPVAESMVILEYIDEAWPQIYPLLPKDAHERSIVRFWARYIDEKIRGLWEFFLVVGERQEKAVEENLKIFKTIEEHGLGEKKFFGGEVIGMADISLGWIVHPLELLEEMAGIVFIEPNTFPRLHAWKENFKAHPIISESQPDRCKALDFFKQYRGAHEANSTN
ncbi:Glutathione S-transferase, N-terminal, partial [Dillenia turbinata]